MKKASEKTQQDPLRPEYNWTRLKGGVRGKYAARYKAGTSLVLRSPDVAEHFLRPAARQPRLALPRWNRKGKAARCRLKSIQYS